MRAVRYYGPKQPLRWEDRPAPAPGPGEVVVQALDRMANALELVKDGRQLI